MDDRPDEFKIIAELFSPLARGYPGALGLTDDAAFISGRSDADLVVTVDTVVQGVHYLADTAPDLVARKLVRVNLSDLAAKGAQPFGILLAASLPKDTDMPWLRQFAAGLGADLDEYRVALLGGDTVATPGPATFSVTAFGWAAKGSSPHRSGAKTGDDIWVTGRLGEGALGLEAALGKLADLGPDALSHLIGRYQLPEPRVAAGLALVSLVSSAMDVSDGLFQDLGHICDASHLRAEVRLDDVPASQWLGRAAEILGRPAIDLLSGGDDYELLVTAAPDRAKAIEAAMQSSGVDIHRIGRMVEGSGVRLLDAAGKAVPLGFQGWRHFGSSEV